MAEKTGNLNIRLVRGKGMSGKWKHLMEKLATTCFIQKRNGRNTPKAGCTYMSVCIKRKIKKKIIVFYSQFLYDKQK